MVNKPSMNIKIAKMDGRLGGGRGGGAGAKKTKKKKTTTTKKANNNKNKTTSSSHKQKRAFVSEIISTDDEDNYNGESSVVTPTIHHKKAASGAVVVKSNGRSKKHKEDTPVPVPASSTTTKRTRKREEDQHPKQQGKQEDKQVKVVEISSTDDEAGGKQGQRRGRRKTSRKPKRKLGGHSTPRIIQEEEPELEAEPELNDPSPSIVISDNANSDHNEQQPPTSTLTSTRTKSIESLPSTSSRVKSIDSLPSLASFDRSSPSSSSNKSSVSAQLGISSRKQATSSSVAAELRKKNSRIINNIVSDHANSNHHIYKQQKQEQQLPPAPFVDSLPSPGLDSSSSSLSVKSFVSALGNSSRSYASSSAALRKKNRAAMKSSSSVSSVHSRAKIGLASSIKTSQIPSRKSIASSLSARKKHSNSSKRKSIGSQSSKKTISSLRSMKSTRSKRSTANFADNNNNHEVEALQMRLECQEVQIRLLNAAIDSLRLHQKQQEHQETQQQQKQYQKKKQQKKHTITTATTADGDDHNNHHQYSAMMSKTTDTQNRREKRKELEEGLFLIEEENIIHNLQSQLDKIRTDVESGGDKNNKEEDDKDNNPPSTDTNTSSNLTTVEDEDDDEEEEEEEEEEYFYSPSLINNNIPVVTNAIVVGKSSPVPVVQEARVVLPNIDEDEPLMLLDNNNENNDEEMGAVKNDYDDYDDDLREDRLLLEDELDNLRSDIEELQKLQKNMIRTGNINNQRSMFHDEEEGFYDDIDDNPLLNDNSCSSVSFTDYVPRHQGQQQQQQQQKRASDVTDSDGIYSMIDSRLKRMSTGVFSFFSATPSQAKLMEEGDGMLSQDTYSVMMCSDVMSIPFFSSVIVFLLQLTTVLFLIYDLITWDAGNPFSIPANVGFSVRSTQFIAIIIAGLTQDDVRTAVDQLGEGYSKNDIGKAFPYSTSWKLIAAMCCKMLQGSLVLIVTFIVIVNENDVKSLLMNFTAIEFISVLDDIAFRIFLVGFFGNDNMNRAYEIANTTYIEWNQNRRDRFNMIFICFQYAALFSGWLFVAYLQHTTKFLCHQIYVQFPDDVDPVLGGYSGFYKLQPNNAIVSSNDARVQYFEQRTTHDNYENDILDLRDRGRFGYCKRKLFWVFNKPYTDDNCDQSARSSGTKTFDITESPFPWYVGVDVNGGSDREKQLDGFQLTCYDDDVQNNCPQNVYGVECDLKDPCEELETSSISGDTSLLRDWARVYKILKFNDTQYIEQMQSIEKEQQKEAGEEEVGENNNQTFTGDKNLTYEKKMTINGFHDTTKASLSTGSIQAYYHPIYWGQRYDSEKDAYDLLIFAGRRWVFINTKDFGEKMQNVTTTNDLVQYFSQNGFHISHLPKDKVQYISESVDFNAAASTLSPMGLRWYHAQYGNQQSFPFADIGRPTDIALKCAICNPESNPCYHDGLCMESSGVCKCQHGATGSLCEFPPMDDGRCDTFFNNRDFQYDGGDCCGATCTDPERCGYGAYDTVFGSPLPRSSDGYPNCKDPAMIPVTIHLQIKNNAKNAIVDLHCGSSSKRVSKNYLHIEGFGEETDKVNGTEVIYVEDGVDCVFDVSTSSIYSINVTIDVYYGEVSNITKIDNTTIANIATFNGPAVQGKSAHVPFLMIRRCLVEELDIVGDNVMVNYITNTTARGKAMLWLNEFVPLLDCETLLHRYALAVLNFSVKRRASGEFLNERYQWLTDDNICRWSPGIFCNPEMDVSELILSDTGLRGTIPTEIGLLVNLERLDFGNNYFDGTIPSEFGYLKRMNELILDKNELTGTIPREIVYMKELETLRLGNNGFFQTVPTEVSQLKKLKMCDLRENLLFGPIPTVLGKMTKLERLHLGDNSLTSYLPTELGLLKRLEQLDVTNNTLTGSIPFELFKLSYLEKISFPMNELTGSIPMNMTSLSKLKQLELQRNNFTSSIPPQIGSLLALESLNLAHNKLTGSLPSEIGSLTKLESFLLTDNQVEGTIPVSVGNLSNLRFFHLDKNRLTGGIPNSIGQISDLKSLYLHDNYLKETLYGPVCELENLAMLVVDCEINKVACRQDCGCRRPDFSLCWKETTVIIGGIGPGPGQGPDRSPGRIPSPGW